MKICVYGVWHLGSVTAGCLAAQGFDVVGLDPDPAVTAALATGKPPLFEPGLEELIRGGLAGERLSFTNDMHAVAACDLVWVAFDTPVDDDDRADPAAVVRLVEALFPYLKDGVVVAISSQLPVGTTRKIGEHFRAISETRRASFAYLPENLRLGQAISAFLDADRIVAGTTDAKAREVLAPILGKLARKVLWVSVEAAEMSKHALNAWLATSIALTNEIAMLCELTGADAAEVEQALRTEPRVGAKAYVRAGGAFAGGTLARDVSFLEEIGEAKGVQLPLLGSVLRSNRAHRGWPLRRLRERLGTLAGKTVAVLGLAYKAGTDSLRRSTAVELCRGLTDEGASVKAYDPKVAALPPDLSAVTLADSALTAVRGADALVVATEWPEFRDLSVASIAPLMRRKLVLDQNRYLPAGFGAAPEIEYLTVGKPS